MAITATTAQRSAERTNDATASAPVGHSGAMTASPAPAPPDAAARIAAVRPEFAARGAYLDTASIGLPPRRALEALGEAVETWRTGGASAREYDVSVETSRQRYAALVGTAPSRVALGSQASVFVGTVAGSVPDGGEVLVPSGEFTSVVFPFMAHADRGVTVREVPLETLADQVRESTSLVAVSAVQSSDGALADLDAVAAAAAVVGARVLVDTTQAAGWLPVDPTRYDYTVGSGYKWLLAARGTCFSTVRDEEAAARLRPGAAGWYAGDDRWESLYGGPLRLAADARRFDVSPASLSWVTQAACLELLLEVGPSALHEHAVGLAGRFRAAVGLPARGSAIVSLPATDEVAAALAAADVAASVRAGRLRLSFHVNNDDADVDAAARVVLAHAGR